MGLKDTILAINDRPLQSLEVPEWGVTVFVAMLSLEEITAAKDTTLTDLSLLTLRDAQGDKVFEAADLPALKQKSYKAVNRILDKFIVVNGFEKDAVAQAKNV